MKLLKLNSTGKEVKIVQYIIGYTTKLGTFTSTLESKVITLQKEYGLTPDGIVGNDTYCALAEKCPILKKKSGKSNGNRAWQTFLGIEVDGIFGSDTLAKTKDFQKKNGLEVDGEVGPMTWRAAFGCQKKKINIVQPKNFKQNDPKWADVLYTYKNTYSKKQTIGSSGCGPSALADIVATWWDSKITPVEMCKLAVDKGYRYKTDGTNHKFFEYVAKSYGGHYCETTSHAYAKAAIENGHYVIVNVGPSRWTTGGHFICWWKISGSTVYINDPYDTKYTASKEKAPYSELKKARKKYFILYKD